MKSSITCRFHVIDDTQIDDVLSWAQPSSWIRDNSLCSNVYNMRCRTFTRDRATIELTLLEMSLSPFLLLIALNGMVLLLIWQTISILNLPVILLLLLLLFLLLLLRLLLLLLLLFLILLSLLLLNAETIPYHAFLLLLLPADFVRVLYHGMIFAIRVRTPRSFYWSRDIFATAISQTIYKSVQLIYCKVRRIYLLHAEVIRRYWFFPCPYLNMPVPQ